MKLPYLDPTSHKSVCCSCGRKTFVNYLGVDDKPIAEGVFGRCDRQDHCRYFLYPYDYLNQLKAMNSTSKPSRRINRINGSSADSTSASKPVTVAEIRRTIPLSHAPVNIPPQTLSRYSMEATLTNHPDNPLARFLHRIFDPLVGEREVNETLRRYCVGTHMNDSVIYWQVDTQGEVRTGKTIAYDAETGKRLHTPGATGWMHRQPYRLEQAFFGSHLLATTRPDLERHNRMRASLGVAPIAPTIWLFESEKAALIAALYLRYEAVKEFRIIPMATGSCDCFNPTEEALANPYHRLQVLRGNNVVLLPDEGMFDKWLEKARRLPPGFSPEISICDMLEPSYRQRLLCDVNPGDGPDDIFLRYIAAGKIDAIHDLPLY